MLPQIHNTHARTHTHTHTRVRARLTALFPGEPGRAGTRKVKPIWILLKQETVSGSGISWAICKSASRSRPCQYPTIQVFLQAGCPSCCPTNSVKALKAKFHNTVKINHLSVLCLGRDFTGTARRTPHNGRPTRRVCQKSEATKSWT